MCAYEALPLVGSERLVLRAPRMDDAGRVAALANDIGVSGNLSRMPHPYGIDDARSFLAKTSSGDWMNGGNFAIEHPVDGLIGMIGFDLSAQPMGPEMGYWLGRPYWGRGYATEAARAALAWASSDWGRRVVVAGHYPDNPASGEVLVKTGFLYTGEVKARPSLARGHDVPTRMMVWLA